MPNHLPALYHVSEFHQPIVARRAGSVVDMRRSAIREPAVHPPKWRTFLRPTAISACNRDA
jgi:hypothetical protein